MLTTYPRNLTNQQSYLFIQRRFNFRVYYCYKLLSLEEIMKYIIQYYQNQTSMQYTMIVIQRELFFYFSFWNLLFNAYLRPFLLSYPLQSMMSSSMANNNNGNNTKSNENTKYKNPCYCDEEQRIYYIHKTWTLLLLRMLMCQTKNKNKQN